MEATSTHHGLARLRSVRRQVGTRAAAGWLGYRLAQRLIDLSVAHVVWLDAANLNHPLPADPDYTFRFLSADEVRTFSNQTENWLNPGLADHVEAGDDLCFAALTGQRLAAFVWFALGGLVAEHCGGTLLSYPAHAAYLYHSYTHPDFRGKRLHGVTTGLGLRALDDRGVQTLVATIDAVNWASKRSCFRLGFVDLGLAVVLKCGRFRAAFYPRAAKALGLKFDKQAEPRSDAAAPCRQYATA